MQGNLLKKVLIIIPALLIPLIYSRSTVDPVLLPKFLAFSIYLLFFLIVIFSSKKKKPVTFFNLNLFKFFIGFIIISAISFTYTIDLPDAIFEWTKIVLNFSFLSLAVLYFQEEEDLIENLCKAIGVLSVIINFIGYYQFYWLTKHQGITHKSTYLVDGTFANRNLFAEVLLLTLPFVTYGALQFKAHWKVICSFGVLSSLFLITATLTRAVWLGLIIAFVCTVILFFLLKIKRPEKNSYKIITKKFLLPVALVIITIGTAVFIYSRQDTSSTFQKQISAISNFNYGAANERLELWKKSAHIFKEHPVKGIGLASWKIEILKYSVVGSTSEDATTFYQEPHNDFIMIATETGIIGLVFYVLLFITIVYYLVFILKHTDTSQHLFYFLLFFGIISYCVISFFSFPKERIEQNIFLMFMFITTVIQYQKVKRLTQQAEPSKDLTADRSSYLLILLFILVAFSMFIGIKRIQSDVHTLKALEAKGKGRWQETVFQINKAISPYYIMDPMSTPLLWYRGTANFNLGRQPEALNDFENAYLLNPNHVHILNNLGTCYEIKKEHSKAIDYFNKALALNPFMEDALFNLSAAYFNSGKADSAYSTIRKCDQENPRYKTNLSVIVPAKFQSIKDSVFHAPLPYIESMQKNWKCRQTDYSKISAQQFAEEYKSNLQPFISAILNNNEWMLKLHEKSVKNNISLEEQIFLDTGFLLKK